MAIDVDTPIKDIIENLRVYFGNDVFFAIALFILFLVLALLVSLIYKKIFTYLSSKTKSKTDDKLVERTEKPIIYFITIIGIKSIIDALNLSGNIITYFQLILSSIIVLIFAFILIDTFDIFIEGWSTTWKRKTKSRYEDSIIPLVHKVVRGFMLISAVIIVLELWGVEIAPFLAGLGIAGIAIGLAVQDSLKDLVGGVMLILDNTYRVGDKIKIEGGEVGTIYSISIRSTRIRTYDNNVIIIPNSKMANSNIINYVQPKASERGKVGFGVVYGSDIEKTKIVAQKAIKSIDMILDDPAPSIEFLDMGDSSLNFRALFWVKSYSEKWDVEREVTQKIYEYLQKENIEFAFPTRTIYIEKGE